MKISINAFYSVKIQFFNELFAFCQESPNAMNYNIIKDMMVRNGWIAPFHMNVPGHDGKLSFGGMCFPKDTNALLQDMKRKGTAHKVLEAVILERNILIIAIGQNVL